MRTKTALIMMVFTAALVGGLMPVKAAETVLLINCGAEKDYTAADGRVWKTDQPFAPGRWGYVGGDFVLRDTTTIQNTADAFIYLNERYSLTGYRIPLPNGKYTVKLHFAETFDELYGEGERVFTVKIDDQPVLTDFDPFKEAGKKYTAVVKTIPVEVKNGELTITFESQSQSPIINGIEILK